MNRKVLGTQNISRMCVVCGTENRSGLHGRFFELEGDELLGVFAPLPEHQGYPGRLHGGIASTVLDETMGRAINIAHPDAWGVTVELNVRYKKPVPLGRDVHVLARITKDSRRIFEGAGEIVLEDGTIAPEATGRYLMMPIDKIVEGDFAAEWFEDPREMPDRIDI